MTADDDTLSLRAGGPDALAACFERYRDRLKAMVVFRLGTRLRGRVDPSDVVQEAYLDAVARLPAYVADPKVVPFVWLRFLTAQRLDILFRTHLGARMRSVGLEVPLDRAGESDSAANLADWLIARGTPVPEQAVRAEVRAAVLAGLERMDEADRQVLILRHFEQLTNGEVAAELGLTEAAASKRYARALMKLKDVLALLSDPTVVLRRP